MYVCLFDSIRFFTLFNKTSDTIVVGRNKKDTIFLIVQSINVIKINKQKKKKAEEQ